MASFNKPDCFLIESWADARLLEAGIEQVRKKYEQLFENVLDEFQSIHRALDGSKMGIRKHGNLGIWKTSWPKWRNWQAGFWIEEIRLDNLTSEAADAPYKCVWIPHPNPEEAEARLRKATADFLDEDGWGIESDKLATSVWCPLEQRKDLVNLLVNGDSDKFIECMVAHAESMVRFIPIVTEIVASRIGD